MTATRLSPRRPEIRAAVAAVGLLALVLALAAATDPSGLLAPIGGHGLPLLGTGGAYRWAPLLVGFPLLAVGTAAPVVVAARAGRWIFLVAWAAVVGAGALATAAVGFAAALPMVGPHLSAGLALRFALATSGFAALKFVLIGLPVAGAATLAARCGPRPDAADESRPTAGAVSGDQDRPGAADRPRADAVPGEQDRPGVADGPRADAVPGDRDRPGGTGVAAAIMFAVLALAAVGFGARWWRGGPVGYAFTGFLVAPSAAAGVLGFLAGMAVFLAAFAGAVRAALRRLPSHPASAGVAVWFAAVVAGCGLGVVDAIIAALPVSAHLADAGPDSWWIGTTLITTSTAIGYGATVGAIGAAVAALAWRWRPTATDTGAAEQVSTGGRLAGMTPRRRRMAGALVAVPLLALPLLIGPTGPPAPPTAAPTPATGQMERLRLIPATDPAHPATIGDATGRQVLLRGINVNQLIDYYLRDPGVPATAPLTDDDFAQIASMGFDVVRLGLSWSRLEPRRGQFDQGYLDRVRTAVAQAKAHGLYTVLDMHEDAWGNALARPGQRCDGGTSATTGWDGAPDWATLTDGTLHCQFMARDLAPAVATAFGNFYTDRDGIQTELVRTWAFVAQAFAGEPAVAGYDLLNEPGIGADPPVSSGLLLGRYYDAAIAAIRDAERGGFAHLVFFEPSVLWSGLGFDAAPPPGFTDDRDIVFAPHPYSESITLDQSLGLTIASIERNLALSARAAAAYGAGLWAGEWGWFGDPATDGPKVWRFAAAQDRLGVGGAFWVWKQGCGSPETGADAVTSGNFVGVVCATGAAVPPPTGFAGPLTRAYPRAFPGRLDRLVSSAGGLRFAATADDPGVDCQLDVWVPGDAEPRLSTQGVQNPAATRVDGGWVVTGCARGAYTVAVDR